MVRVQESQEGPGFRGWVQTGTRPTTKVRPAPTVWSARAVARSWMRPTTTPTGTKAQEAREARGSRVRGSHTRAPEVRVVGTGE